MNVENATIRTTTTRREGDQVTSFITLDFAEVIGKSLQDSSLAFGLINPTEAANRKFVTAIADLFGSDWEDLSGTSCRVVSEVNETIDDHVNAIGHYSEDRWIWYDGGIRTGKQEEVVSAGAFHILGPGYQVLIDTEWSK